MQVIVLSDVRNNVVVHTEGRRYPALAVQGDRLKEWARLADSGDVELLADELRRSLAEYGHVCRENGIDPP
jgi:hypothetical protein